MSRKKYSSSSAKSFSKDKLNDFKKFKKELNLKNSKKNETTNSEKNPRQWLQYQLKRTLKNLFILYIALNILIPLIIYVWPNVMSHMIFQTFIHVPFKNLSDPSSFGLTDTHAFMLDHDDVKLGAWHVLPNDKKLISTSNLKDHFRLNIEPNDTNPPIVILYLHGNTNDRSTGHRLELYKLLRKLDYHVVAVDYRGYGDSTGIATEIDVVRDALFTYEYLKKVAPSAVIYLWGHSLGTGITSSVSRMLTERGRPAVGVILEAPFFNIVEEVELHPFFWAFYFNKIMLWTIENALEKIELQFRSDIHLTKVSSKIMILHAEDDYVIPIYQAEKVCSLIFIWHSEVSYCSTVVLFVCTNSKLNEVVSTKGISENLTFHRISSQYGCGHRNIYTSPNITDIIKSFVV